MNKAFTLQLFGEGGGAAAGTSAGASAGTEGGQAASASVSGASLAAQDGDLSNVVYGKSNQTVVESNTETQTPVSKTEDKSKTFDEMIKKGGEYADEFNKRTQDIINKRFKETKNLQSQLASQNEILDAMYAKYGTESGDIEGLKKAIAEDDSLYEEQAFKEGLTVKQFKDKLALEKENQRLKAAEEEQRSQQHSREIYSQWLKDGDALVQKYGIQNFDLARECENPDFTRMLGDGISFEAAYKAVHFDDMLGGAMAQTASTVTQQMANNIASRSSRPSEAGMESSTSQVFKSDVNKFTDADINEILRRVKAGENIYL